MNVIDELVEKLCPDGVSILKLGKLESDGVVILGRGEVISKTDLANHEGEFPVYSSSASDTGVFGHYGKYMFDDTRITWSIDGGGKFFFRNPHKYSVTNVCGWLKVVNVELLDPKYLYYVLISVWATRTYNYTVKAHPSVIKEDYLIPLPPIEIQKEIVRILGTFNELEEELEAELKARKKQYRFYLEKELSSKYEYRLLKLGDICSKVSAGGDLPPNLKKGQREPSSEHPYPVFSNGTGDTALYGYSDSFAISERAVTISARGTIGFHAIREPNFTPIVRLISIIPNEEILTVDFLNLSLNIAELKFNNGGIPQLTVPDLKETLLKIPSLAEQEDIVKRMNSFERFLTDLSEGLPAEIDARRKQYEYYRDKLLTFKELESA